MAVGPRGKKKLVWGVYWVEGGANLPLLDSM